MTQNNLGSHSHYHCPILICHKRYLTSTFCDTKETLHLKTRHIATNQFKPHHFLHVNVTALIQFLLFSKRAQGPRRLMQRNFSTTHRVMQQLQCDFGLPPVPLTVPGACGAAYSDVDGSVFFDVGDLEALSR
jgi:hypothetical protein